MKSSSSGPHSKRVVCQGDLVALHGSVTGLGFLSVPRFTEPIPERDESVSHLRACSSAVDDAPPDFMERCVFRLVDEKGQVRQGEPLLFGAIVRLVHESSGCTLVASDNLDYSEDKSKHFSRY